MENFSILEVIEQAVQTERIGCNFYTSMAEKFRDDEKLVRLFTTLADKERIHEKIFTELKGIIGSDEPEGWDEASLYLRAIVESEFFLGKDKALVSMQNIHSIKEAVDFAMRFEKETLLYYFGIRDAVKQKEVVDEIINEEKSHIRWLAEFKSALVK
ncbi:MAG: ferritin family protein [Nitrospiraceae bacterium]|nr:ferritin family protein [Nitrospiraceae bacterium]